MDLSGNIVGVVLAGGESRRMGRDKTRLRLPGSPDQRTLVESATQLLRPVCREVVVADRGRGIAPGSVADGPGRGPAAGILGAAEARPGHDLLVLACDLPRIPGPLLEALADVPDGDWIVPAWGQPARFEPLCALYRQAALTALGEQVRRGTYAVHRLADASGLAVRRLGEAALADFGPPEELFHNLNTPADLAALSLRSGETGG